MRLLAGNPWFWPVLGVILSGLAGCGGGPRPVAAVPVAPVVTTAGTAGTVVALRAVATSVDTGSRTGIDAVLAALQQPAPPGDITAQEVVVQRDGDTGTSFVTPAAGFAVGDRVVIEGGTMASVAK